MTPRLLDRRPRGSGPDIPDSRRREGLFAQGVARDALFALAAFGDVNGRAMCNLYSLTKGQSAIRDLFSVKHDRAGNLPLFPSIFPDQVAPIVRRGPDGERELVTARWGMPGPPQFGGQPVTNIRNVTSPHWRGWLGNRCVVPATSFCEYADTRPHKTPIWFALGEDRPLFAFAGLWAR